MVAFNLRLTFLHIVYSKNRMEVWGCYDAYRKQEDITNVDHMIVNDDIATVRDFMFCSWPQIRMVKLIKKKLTSLDKLPTLNYSKFWILSFCSPPLIKTSEKIAPTNMSCLKSCRLTLYQRRGERVKLCNS